MKYLIDKQELYSIFSLMEDNLNSLIAPDLKSEFVMLHTEGAKNFILDLSNVKFVDSSGLSAILTANRLWKSEQSHFVLTGILNPSVKKLIEISKLDTILSIQPSTEDAVEFVQKEEASREM
jgi:anti-sigma B factor antagonist